MRLPPHNFHNAGHSPGHVHGCGRVQKTGNMMFYVRAGFALGGVECRGGGAFGILTYLFNTLYESSSWQAPRGWKCRPHTAPYSRFPACLYFLPFDFLVMILWLTASVGRCFTYCFLFHLCRFASKRVSLVRDFHFCCKILGLLTLAKKFIKYVVG